MIRHPLTNSKRTNLVRLGLVAGLSLVAIPLFASPEIAPAPASTGADVPVAYFGPAPSSVEPELIGPHQLLTAGQLDLTAGTVKLPLYK